MSDMPHRSGALRWLPPTHVIAALCLGGILFGITIAKGVQDPDYFWHVTAGRIIATTGEIPSVDPFSFTWQGQPWTPHEWLTELLIYRLVDAFGDVGALAIFGLLPGITVLAISLVLGRLGIRTITQIPVLILASLTLSPYTTLRPQAISWLLLAILIGLLTSVRPDNRHRLLLIGPMLLVWANLHGLYIIGIGVICAYALFTLLNRTPLRGHPKWAIGAVALAIGGAMVTPAGPLGVLYPLRYSQEWGLANIQEWQSPNFHDPGHWPLLVLVLWLMLSGGRGTPGWLQAIAYVGTAMALVALRNTPVAAVLAAPTLAFGLELRIRERWGAPRPGSAATALPRRVMELGIAIIIIIASFVMFLPQSLGVGAIESQREGGYPVEAADQLLADLPRARVVAEYGWGGYVIYRLYDAGGRVFIDGRNDMYEESILDDYTTVSVGDPGWEDIVDRHGADAMLFPPYRAITKGIAQAAGWCEAYRDDEQVLLLRDCS
jgi:hypothetical protein